MNGRRSASDHPEVPIGVDAVVADAIACWTAGASSVHVHPRRASDGAETLAAVDHDAVVAGIRAAVPGLEISCSTPADIDVGPASDRIAAARA